MRNPIKPVNYDYSHLDQNLNEWEVPFCSHPQHEAPKMMVIPVEGYTHICPGCGRKIHIHTNQVIM